MHRNLEIDRLRAFAVLMTICIHFSRIFFPWNMHQGYAHGGGLLNLLENSWMGVDLFFVISGYIISKVIVEKMDNHSGNIFLQGRVIKEFFVKRFFRIYPLVVTFYIFVLLCSIFLNKSGFFSSPENNIEAGISIFTYTFNYYFGSGEYHAFTLSPYWSLSVEEQFYLLFPFFLMFVKSHKHRILILFSFLFLISFIIRPLSDGNIFYTQNRCDGLIYGCILYYLSINKIFLSLFSTLRGNTLFIKSSIVMLIFILATITAIGFPMAATIPIGSIISTILVAIASLEINAISFGGYVNTVLDYIGSRSYSLYIVHFPMFTLTQELFYRLSLIYHWEIGESFALPYSVVAFALTILISECSYRFIEKIFILKGKRYILKGKRYINCFINKDTVLEAKAAAG